MTIWHALFTVFCAGAVGGITNALISDNGLVRPRRVRANGVSILRAGWLGNLFIGGVSAAVSWCLYGPLAKMSVQKADAVIPTDGLTVAAIGGALLVGASGARWLSSEVDKSLLRAAGAKTAKGQNKDDLAAAFAVGTSFEAFQLAGEADVESSKGKKK